MLAQTAIPKKSEKTASRIIDNEAVIIALEKQESIVLNAAGTRIWGQMDGERTISDIALALTGEFDVELSAALKDTREFVEELIEKGIAST